MAGPVIALTSGEPAGIGPEIAAAAWRALSGEGDAPFFLIGDADYLATRCAGLPVRRIGRPEEASSCFGASFPVLHRPLAAHPKAGTLDPANAPAVIAAITEAVELALSGAVAGIVTNPIQKGSLYGAGFPHQGHTDFISHLARARGHIVHEAMMLVAADLRAIPVTVHIPLAAVPGQLTSAAIIAQARAVRDGLRRYFGIESPRLSCTGLNPHAGEGGAMGREEIDILGPALRELAADGIAVSGPLPADTAFHAEARRNYDAILCMYHDQALIPVKTLDFHGGVNVTLGLPFIRTSPDHGTALDIAGRGTARPDSLIAALRLAARMAATAARTHG